MPWGLGQAGGLLLGRPKAIHHPLVTAWVQKELVVFGGAVTFNVILQLKYGVCCDTEDE